MGMFNTCINKWTKTLKFIGLVSMNFNSILSYTKKDIISE